MYSDLAGKTAVVTGGSSGIGEAIIKRLVSEGCNTVNFDIKSGGGTETVFIEVDIRDEDVVKDATRKIKEKFGKIDILINNAGVNISSKLHEIGIEEWNKIIGVNLTGTFLVSKHVIPYMLENGSGTIVNLSSVNGISSTGRDAAYSASKAGIMALTRSMAVDYAPVIRVVGVSPGSVDTPAQKKAITEAYGCEEKSISKGYAQRASAHPMGRIARPGEIASVVAFLCSAESSFVDGGIIEVDGGLLARNPASV